MSPFQAKAEEIINGHTCHHGGSCDAEIIKDIASALLEAEQRGAERVVKAVEKNTLDCPYWDEKKLPAEGTEARKILDDERDQMRYEACEAARSALKPE